MRTFLLLFSILFLSCLSLTELNAQFTLSDEELGTFITVGAAWGDYDNDGDEDVYLSNGSLNGDLWENYLFSNDGTGNFTQVTDAGTIVTDAFTSGGCSWGDFNNDGWLDLLVGHPLTSASGGNQSRNSLYINNGDDTFSDLSSDPLTDVVGFSRIDPAWGDWNNDGFLDVLCSNATFMGTGDEHAFFENNGDGSFSETSNEISAGSSARGTVNWVDVDQDGDMDALTVSGAPGQRTVLWVNNGTDFDEVIIVDSGQGVGQDSKGASFGDYDNDGDFDLYIVNQGDNGDANMLFRNDGLDGNNIPIFTEMDSDAGELVTDTDFSLSSAWGDVDNDGDLDLFVGNDGGYPDYRSRLYINNGAILNNVSTVLNSEADFAHCNAFADVDKDGDLDLVVGRDGQNRLFLNGTEGNNWVQFNLKPSEVNTNKAAIGTIVKVTATINQEEVTQVRQVDAHTGAGSQSSLILHFGLGDATTIDELVVMWAGSGLTETTSWTDINGIFELEEGTVSSVDQGMENLPSHYSLSQNYPNPFNPTTTIRFSLKKTAYVSLRIFDITGREVAMLVDGIKTAGRHEVAVTAENWSSGVYFYKLQSESFEAIRKMMVLR
jgi:hypothetical protein